MRTLKVKLVLDEGQKASLLKTMEAYTEAFNLAAKWGFQNRVTNRFALHRAIYYSLREDIPALGASLTQSAMYTACEALRSSKMRRAPRRKKHSAIRYGWKEARVWFESGKVSITSVEVRIRAAFVQSNWFRSFLDWTAKASVLTYNKKAKTFYLEWSLKRRMPPSPCPARSWV